MTLEEEKTEPFSEINKILESLKKRDVTIALQWAEDHKDFLAVQVSVKHFSWVTILLSCIRLLYNFYSQNSGLIFKLHQLRFIQLIEKGMTHQTEAMQYARTFLTQYVDSHEKGENIENKLFEMSFSSFSRIFFFLHRNSKFDGHISIPTPRFVWISICSLSYSDIVGWNKRNIHAWCLLLSWIESRQPFEYLVRIQKLTFKNFFSFVWLDLIFPDLI